MNMQSPSLRLVEPGNPSGSTSPGAGTHEISDFIHVSLNHNLSLADRKAGILFTLVSGVIIYLFESKGTAPLTSWSNPATLLWGLMALSFAVAALAAFGVIRPRFRKGHCDLLYWGAIGSTAQAARWINRLQLLNDEDLRAVRLYHCHALAQICVAKYGLLRLSMNAALVGLLSFISFSLV